MSFEWSLLKHVIKIQLNSESKFLFNYNFVFFSGGVKRDWIGFPRLYFSSTSDKTKCVCVHVNDLNHPHVKLYENCEAKSRSCSLPPL